MSPTLSAGSPLRTENTATIISGTEVNVARRMNPPDISLKPVNSISFSIAFIA